MKTVIIFGGSGFVGTHVIRRIAKKGHKIIIPHQRNVNEAKLRLLGSTGQIIPIRYNSLKEEKIINIVGKSDVVINLKTSWDEKKMTFRKAILDFNIDLVDLIKSSNKSPQFIFFSGLGTDHHINSTRSEFVYESEKYIQQNLIDNIIVRPGIIIGGGDKFLGSLIPLFKMSFFIPLFGDGLSKFQPVFIDDISIAINQVVENDLRGNHIFEFYGSDIFTYKEFYNHLAEYMNKTRVLLPIPLFLVKFGVSILEKTPFSPLNSEQLKLFETNNIGSNKHKNFSDLNIYPQDLREIIKKIIKKNT